MIETILFYDQQMIWESQLKGGNVNPFAKKQFDSRQLFVLGLQDDYEWGWSEYKVKKYESKKCN